jgi:hypothetical protein
MLLRNLNQKTAAGAVVLGTPYAGKLASELPTGFPLSGLLNNDVAAGDPVGTLYCGTMVTWPSAGKFMPYEDGSFSFTDAPDGTYNASMLVKKFSPTAGLFYSDTAPITLTIGQAATQPADTTAPSMSGSVTISAITANGAHAAWQAATDNVAVTGYEVSVDAGTPSWVDVGNVASYNVSGKAASTAYTFRLRAYDGAGNKATPITAPFTTAAAADVAAPVMSGSVTTSAVTSSSVHAAWIAASDNTAVTGYEISCDTGTANWLNVGNVLLADVSALSGGTAYTFRVRAYDAAGNKSSPITAPFTTSAATNGGGPVTTLFTPSASRTVIVQAASKDFKGGAFWDFSDAKKPRGTKDPDATIDITFDWTAWLADMGDAQIASVVFIVSGLTSAGSYPTATKASVLVTGGTVSATPASVTCRVTTDSSPPRIDDRTVYLVIGEQ